MIVLSIDSGIEKTGYAIVQKKTSSEYKYITSGLIKTSKKDDIQTRINEIYNKIKVLIAKYSPNIIVLERLFLFKNQKTVIGVSQSQGAIMLLAKQNNIPIKFLTPLEIKQTITGYGNADKRSVQKMLNLTLNLKQDLSQDDTADAVAAGISYLIRSNFSENFTG